MTIREAGVGDVAALVAIVNAAFRVEAFFKTGDRTDADDIRARMRRGRFLIAEDENGDMAGAVFVAMRGHTGYFGMLSIDPSRQGQGLGTRLTKLAEDACREAGCTQMEIEVVNLRAELPPYYRRLGYVERGTRPFPDAEQTSRPCHFIVMDKTLRS